MIFWSLSSLLAPRPATIGDVSGGGDGDGGVEEGEGEREREREREREGAFMAGTRD